MLIFGDQKSSPSMMSRRPARTAWLCFARASVPMTTPISWMSGSSNVAASPTGSGKMVAVPAHWPRRASASLRQSASRDLKIRNRARLVHELRRFLLQGHSLDQVIDADADGLGRIEVDSAAGGLGRATERDKDKKKDYMQGGSVTRIHGIPSATRAVKRLGKALVAS